MTNDLHQCPWFAGEIRLESCTGAVKEQRKSIIVSKSKEMVDLTMALFVKFWVNGNQEALLSLLD